MKALSLWQPWASVIFEKDDAGVAVKPDETRGWSTHYRGPLAIHAAKYVMTSPSKRQYETALAWFGLRWDQLPFGCIVGVVELVDCRPAPDVARERTEWQRFWGDYREIGDDGKKRYALTFKNPVKLKVPLPYKGKQGFLEVPDHLLLDLHKPVAALR